ncbi:uncharacterized protein LOC143213467 [Lasioglossum baleicum]|uniref:uncharacterized protein LOC143213467 n=1 Tax=Lasioglossum baleicum TaxID=434251 RepID=UPI003FCEDF04
MLRNKQKNPKKQQPIDTDENDVEERETDRRMANTWKKRKFQLCLDIPSALQLQHTPQPRQSSQPQQSQQPQQPQHSQQTLQQAQQSQQQPLLQQLLQQPIQPQQTALFQHVVQQPQDQETASPHIISRPIYTPQGVPAARVMARRYSIASNSFKFLEI